MYRFGGETEGKRPLGKPKNRWDDNNRLNLIIKLEVYGLDSTGPG
jgi:hypothetical protein